MPNLATRGPIGNAKRATFTLDATNTAVAGQGMVQGALDSSCKNPTGAGQRCVGVVDYVPFGSSACLSLIQEGECIAICGTGGVNAGDYVKMDASGLFVTSSTTADEVVGRARSSATTSGDQFVLDVDPFIL